MNQIKQTIDTQQNIERIAKFNNSELLFKRILIFLVKDYWVTSEARQTSYRWGQIEASDSVKTERTKKRKKSCVNDRQKKKEAEWQTEKEITMQKQSLHLRKLGQYTASKYMYITLVMY